MKVMGNKNKEFGKTFEIATSYPTENTNKTFYFKITSNEVPLSNI